MHLTPKVDVARSKLPNMFGARFPTKVSPTSSTQEHRTANEDRPIGRSRTRTVLE